MRGPKTPRQDSFTPPPVSGASPLSPVGGSPIEDGECSPDRQNKPYLAIPGVVLISQNLLQCGLLDLQSPAGPDKCFFLARDVVLSRSQRKGEEMSDWLRPGTRVRVNARRVSQKSQVPFIATTVWAESESKRLTEEMKNKVFQEIPKHVMDKYNKVSVDILRQLKKGLSDSR